MTQPHTIRPYYLAYEMRFWGYDLSIYTDEEIKEGMMRHAEVVKDSGLTIDEVANAMRSISKL